MKTDANTKFQKDILTYFNYRGRLRQHGSIATQNRDRAFQTLGRAFVFLLRLQMLDRVHDFFISNTFISNTRMELAKNQVNGKQHPEAEHLLFEN